MKFIMIIEMAKVRKVRWTKREQVARGRWSESYYDSGNGGEIESILVDDYLNGTYYPQPEGPCQILFGEC